MLVGTGIATTIIAQRYKAGESIEELAEDYGRSRSDIEEAIRLRLAGLRDAGAPDVWQETCGAWHRRERPQQSARKPFEAVGDLFDPNQVKVAVSPSGDALYFSRSAIPYFRAAKGHLTFDYRAALFERREPLEGYWKHVGIYAYRKDALLQFARTAPTPLERAESLEQLRLLETGRRIRVLDSDFRSVGVDTPQEMRRAAQVLDEREARREAMR